MLNLENWAWAECQLVNIGKRAHQFNLLDEKRKECSKKGEKKNERKRREGREKWKGGSGKDG